MKRFENLPDERLAESLLNSSWLMTQKDIIIGFHKPQI